MSTARLCGDSERVGRTMSTDAQPTMLQFTLDASLVPGFEGDELTADRDASIPISRLQQRVGAACQRTDAEQQLADAVEVAKEESLRRLGTIDLRVVAAELRSRHGYIVRVRQAMGAKHPRAYLRSLRHTFMVVRGLEGQEGTDVIIDFSFLDHFVLLHAVPWYDALVSELPQDWVGPLDALALVVGVMATAMRLAFEARGMALPPWREPRAVLSKWLPEWYEDELAPLLPCMDIGTVRMLAPYHGTPFRAAVAAGRCSTQPTSTLMVPHPHPPNQAGRLGAVQAPPAAGGERGRRAARPPPEEPRRIITGFPARAWATHKANSDQNALPGDAGMPTGDAQHVLAVAVDVVAMRAKAGSAMPMVHLVMPPLPAAAAGPPAAAAPCAMQAKTPAWVQECMAAPQQQQRRASPECPAPVPCDAPGATAAAATVCIGATANAAAPPAAVFKSLDALLPRIRTVKLGVA